MLQTYEQLPQGFLDARADELAGLLGGPALIHLPGERPAPLFVALLLHGNETTGLQAVQQLLHGFRGRALPRALSLFVGNVDAAAAGMRRLPEQPDYNRIWPQADDCPVVAPCPETDLALAVCRALAPRRPFAAVDIHNNNGRNPHYACINELRPAWLQLARRFGRRVLYFTDPAGTLSASFSRLAPAVTLECGRVGDAAGVDHAVAFLGELLRAPGLPHVAPAAGEVDLYRSAARLTVPETVSIGVGDSRAQLHLPPDLEDMNWWPQAAGTPLARIEGLDGTVLDVRDPRGADVAGDYLRRRGDVLELARGVTPAMFTTDTRIVRQDCLGYLLEPVASPCVAESDSGSRASPEEEKRPPGPEARAREEI